MKKIISAILAILMIIGLTPASAFAEEREEACGVARADERGANAGLTVKATSNVFPTASETYYDISSFEDAKGDVYITVSYKMLAFNLIINCIDCDLTWDKTVLEFKEAYNLNGDDEYTLLPFNPDAVNNTYGDNNGGKVSASSFQVSATKFNNENTFARATFRLLDRTAAETTVDFHANRFVLEQKKSGELFTVVSGVAGFDQGVYEAVFSSGNNHCATEISPKGDTPPVVSYDLWIGGEQVTGRNLSGEGWEYDPDTNTLTLDDFTYNGAGHYFRTDALFQSDHSYAAAIVYSGAQPLDLVVHGSNSLSCTYGSDVICVSGLVCFTSLTVEGDGTLDLRCAVTSNYVSYAAPLLIGGDLTVKGAKINCIGPDMYHISYGIRIEGDLKLEDGEIYAAGGSTQEASFGAYVGGTIAASGGKLTAVGGDVNYYFGDSYGLYTSSKVMSFDNCSVEVVAGNIPDSKFAESIGICFDAYSDWEDGGTVTIGSAVKSFTASGKTAAISNDMANPAVHGDRVKTTKVINAVTGTGWTDVDGTEDETTIALSATGADLYAYKKVEFPYYEKYNLWIGETQVTDANCADIPGVTGEDAKAEYDPDTGTLTLTDVKGVTGVAPGYVDDALIAFKGDLTIRLVGENSLVCDDDVIAIMAIDGSLTVEGEGSLKVDSNFVAVKVKKDLNLNGGTLDFSTNREISGMYTVLSAYGLIYSGGALSVDGGVLKAELDLWTDPILYSKTDAVKAYDISIAKGEIDVKVIASTAGKQAIVNALKALNNVTVTGGKVTVDAPLCENGIYASNRDYLQSGGTVASSAEEALFASNTFTISGGEITLTATGDDEYSCGLSTNKGIFFLDGTEKVSVTSENGVPVKGFRNGNGPITVDDKLFISVPEGGSIGQNKWGDPIIVDAKGDPAKTVEIIPVVEYDLWVGETRVTNANCRSIPGVTGDGAKAEYDPETQTLTLTDVTGVSGNYQNAAIYAKDLHLTIKGTSNLSCSFTYGILVDKSMHGSCSLTLDGDLTFSARGGSIYSFGPTTIAGGTVKALPSSNASEVHIAVGSHGDLTFTGGRLEAKSIKDVAIASTSEGGIIIPDGYYIRTPYGGSVAHTQRYGGPFSYIADANDNIAIDVIIAPKTYYDITLSVGDHGTASAPDAALAGQPITLTLTPDEDYEVDRVSIAYGMVENLLYRKGGMQGSLPVTFTMPDSAVTVTVTFSAIYYTGLSSLTVSEGTLDPEFKTKVHSYTDAVGCGVDEVTVSFEATSGHKLQLDETQFKEGTLTYVCNNTNYPNTPTGATGTVVLTGASTELKIKTIPINGSTVETVYTVTFTRPAHTLSHHAKVDPKCTETGTEEYWECTVCRKLFSDKDGKNAIDEPAVIGVLGHDFSVEDHADKYLKDEATCTESAVYYKSCSRCDTASDKETDVFSYGDPLGHSFTAERAEEGYLKDKADCEHKAVYYKSCSRCDTASDKDTFEYGEPNGHTPGQPFEENRVEPTCGKEGGYDEVVCCVVCGKEISRQSRKIDRLPEDDCPSKRFTDIPPKGAAAHDAVDWAVLAGVTGGTSKTTFSPDAPVTRAQLVTFLWRAFGSPEPAGTAGTFKDVKQGKYYFKAVMWAAENGITAGVGKGYFAPNDECTRSQLALFLWRAAGSLEPGADLSAFTDIPEKGVFRRAIIWAENNGLVFWIEGERFLPEAFCTRVQSIETIWKLCVE